MADGTKALDENDEYIISSIQNKNTIILVNKADENVICDVSALKNVSDKIIEFSVKTKKGLEEFEALVKEMFGSGEIESNDDAMITGVRHKQALVKAKEALESAIDAIVSGIEINMTFIDIENAISALGEITGQTVEEEIVDTIFHSFCVGK